MKSLENLVSVGVITASLMGCGEGYYVAPYVEISPQNPTTDDELTCRLVGRGGKYNFSWSVGESVVFEEGGKKSVLDPSYTTSGVGVMCSTWITSPGPEYFSFEFDFVVIEDLYE